MVCELPSFAVITILVSITQRIVIVTVLAGGIGAAIHQRIEIRELRDENETLRQHISDEGEMLSRYFTTTRMKTNQQSRFSGPYR